jgi:hypothetical protein
MDVVSTWRAMLCLALEAGRAGEVRYVPWYIPYTSTVDWRVCARSLGKFKDN